jgi:peroxidase
VFSPAQLTQIKQTSLAAVLCNNGDAIDKVTKDVFLLPSKQEGGIMSCEKVPQMQLSFWAECCQGEWRLEQKNAVNIRSKHL